MTNPSSPALDAAIDSAIREKHAKDEADRARFLTEYGYVQCPNCYQQFIHSHEPSPCVLYVVAQVVREREQISEYEVLERMRKCSVDGLWDSFANWVLNPFESGEFNKEEA